MDKTPIKRVLFFDVETTGIPDRKLPADDPAQPRICSFAALLCEHSPDLLVRQAVHMLACPDGWTVPENVVAIHGLTTELLVEYGVPTKLILEVAADLMLRADQWTAHSVDFDLKMLRGEFRRAGMDDLFDKRPKFCTMRGTAAALGTGWPKLKDAYRHFVGKELTGAHGAAADVRACREIYRHLGFSRTADMHRHGAITPAGSDKMPPEPAGPQPREGYGGTTAALQYHSTMVGTEAEDFLSGGPGA